MKKLGFFILIYGFCISSQAFNFSQDTKVFKKKISKRPGASLSERTHKLLIRAQEDLSSGQIKRAFAMFKKLEVRTVLNPSENAQVVQALAYAYAQKGQNQKALKAFEKTLDIDSLPQAATLSIIYIIAQLEMMNSKYKKTEEIISFWLKVAPSSNSQVYAILAGALYGQKKKKEALKAIQKAIDLTTEPKESWLAMAVSLYFANEKYKEATKALKILVAQNPTKEVYWKQWAAGHLSTGEEAKGLVVLEMGYLMGTVGGDKQIQNASSLMISTDIPYKAAMWIENKLTKKERGTLKAQKQLASAYMSARENKKALKILKEIHKTNPEVRTSIQLGQILLAEEKWVEARVIFQSIKDMKLNLEDKEQIYMGLGVAYFNLSKLDLSRQSFIVIADKSEAARGWLSFIQSETRLE